MSSDHCSFAPGFTVTCLVKRASFVFGFLTFTMFVFSPMNGGTEAPLTDKELGSLILLKASNGSISCKNPNSSETVCAGVIISKKYILTAGSCLDNDTINIYAGLLRVYTKQVLKIDEGYRHSGYTLKPYMIRNDLAILKPARKIELSKYVTKAKLAEPNHKFRKGTSCSAVIMTENPPKGVQIETMNLTIVEPFECNIGGPTEFCVEHEAGLKLPGTPLWCPVGKEKKMQFVVAGILSRKEMNYTVYTNVLHYNDWIESIGR